MLLGLLATTIAWTVETFTGGVMLGIAVYTAARSGKNTKRKK